MKLNIVHKFTLLSAAATVVITVGMGLLVSHIVTAGMLRDEGQITASALRSVTSIDLRPEVFDKAATGREQSIFDYIWHHLHGIPDVYRMWVYDADGRIVWTSAGYVGWDRDRTSPGLRRALAGEPGVKLDRADELYEYEAGLAQGEVKLEVFAPLLGPDNQSVYGVVELWKRPASFLESRRRLMLIIWVAGAVGGIALFLSLHGFFRRALREQVRLREAEKHLENVELELEVAGEIQNKLLPAALPDVPGYSLAAWHQSAHEVGGDYYDAFVTRDGDLALIVADSEGSGMPGALVAARVRHHIRAEPEAAVGAAGVIESIDRMLSEQAGPERRVSVLVARVSAESGELRYCNVGRCAGLLSRDGAVSQLASDGTPAGGRAGGSRTEHLLTLRPGDCILLCTDGVLEARDASGRAFGEDRLRELLLHRRAAAAQEVVYWLRQEVGWFAADETPADDMTVLCLVAGGAPASGGRPEEDGGGSGP